VTQNPVKVWPELLQEGAKFGIDFSDPIFHTLDKPETVERKCIPFQESFLEKYKRQTICGLSEKTYRLSFSIFKKDMSEEDNLFLAFSGVSKRDASVNSQQVLEVVTNKNNALYYQAKKGDKLIETWTTFLIENEVTKKNEIKASVILRFNPGVKEDFILEKVNEYRSAVTSAIVVKN
jgi:hypothetical protein